MAFSKLATAGLLLAAMASSSTAHAQEEPDPYAPCAAMSDDAQRLACFDATFADQRVVRAEEAERRIEEARLAEQRAIEEARAAEERRIAEFGMHNDEEEEEMTITSAVVDVFTDGLGNRLITLENGQMWREVNGSSMRASPRAGWIAEVERHWSGAYTMRFEGRRGFIRMDRYR